MGRPVGFLDNMEDLVLGEVQDGSRSNPDLSGRELRSLRLHEDLSARHALFDTHSHGVDEPAIEAGMGGD